jgi:hypothetical protein
MTRSFVRPDPGAQTLKDLAPSTPEEIRRMARTAGLDLPEALMRELVSGFPAFEAMVRRLPRARAWADEPAHHFVAPARVRRLDGEDG